MTKYRITGIHRMLAQMQDDLSIAGPSKRPKRVRPIKKEVIVLAPPQLPMRRPRVAFTLNPRRKSVAVV